MPTRQRVGTNTAPIEEKNKKNKEKMAMLLVQLNTSADSMKVHGHSSLLTVRTLFKHQQLLMSQPVGQK